METKLFINESISPHYKCLWVNYKKLCNRKLIHSVSTVNGVLMFRFEEHGPERIVTHQQDLKDLFPDVDIVAL